MRLCGAWLVLRNSALGGTKCVQLLALVTVRDKHCLHFRGMISFNSCNDLMNGVLPFFHFRGEDLKLPPRLAE
jgi:hypothetical protein